MYVSDLITDLAVVTMWPLGTRIKSVYVNPIFVGGGLIAPAVSKTSSIGVSFDFCDLKT